MKNGFTFVEVIAVISLLSILVVFLIPNLFEFSEKTKKELYNSKISKIEEVSIKYANIHLDEIDNEKVISVNDLIKEDLIKEEDNVLKNPLTNFNMNNCEIKITYNGKKVKTVFIKEKNEEKYNEKCGDNI